VTTATTADSSTPILDSEGVGGQRKQRGAFFTPPSITRFLTSWAVRSQSDAVLDPNCGDGAFLVAATERLRTLGASGTLRSQLLGVDVDEKSLFETSSFLAGFDAEAELFCDDFFNVFTPDQLGSLVPYVDAVVGNPPFVRYQTHAGPARARSLTAAQAQGVSLSGLASSWAALVPHACAFLKPSGRLAMVLPAELLTVRYAEPIREWLLQRFSSVHLYVFEQLQFADALEKVVLVHAAGSGGCDAFTLHYINDGSDLPRYDARDGTAMAVQSVAKWTDLFLTAEQRQLVRHLIKRYFVSLSTYGKVGLGTVTGANSFFTLSEDEALEHGIQPIHLEKIVPPGTRNIPGLHFDDASWEKLRDTGQATWLLVPEESYKRDDPKLENYLALGERQKINEQYKCRTRKLWWRPPVVPPPDLFFTYMSHVTPRLIANRAGVSFVNTMHGVWLEEDQLRGALPYLALNTLTLLSAELEGRSYGGGLLKLEPREAGNLALPDRDLAATAWTELEPRVRDIDDLVASGATESATEIIDNVLFRLMDVDTAMSGLLQDALQTLRNRRLA
jgi:adenine-specific DNA-methyltransferase